MSRQRHRREVNQDLGRVRRRLRRLKLAERSRDRVTARRKRVYQRRRLKHGERHPLTLEALELYRVSRRLSHRIDESQQVLRERAERKVKWLRANPAPLDPDGDGLVVVDGKQVSVAIAREVLRIRRAGRWQGVVVSGYRTPEYSRQLCYGICGAPVCPGRCAGTSSRHTRKGGRDGAIDVSDYWTFRAECARLGSWLENHLPSDPVHFSDIGN